MAVDAAQADQLVLSNIGGPDPSLYARIDEDPSWYLGDAILTTRLDQAVNWARKNSIWPMTFGLACCAIEMMSMGASRFDVARFGAEVFRGSPRQSDLMIIAGRVSTKMAPVVRQLYQQMPEPKWAISMGACATSTGVYSNYALIPVNQIIPIDVYVHLRLAAAAREDRPPGRLVPAGPQPPVAGSLPRI
jgi:NADH-quinone oxidoreductase subunit B